MKIRILGTGCPNCRRLEQRTREALDTLELDTEVEKVEDLPAIVAYGVTRTPALVVDDRVVLSGRVPAVGELAALLGSGELEG